MSEPATVHDEGSRVFLLDGRECEYVGVAGRLHVVASIYETEYGDQTGEAFTVEQVYSNPPTEKLHSDIAALTERVADLQQQQWGLQAEIRDNERITKERLKSLSRYKALERVEDFVEGRITHCVLTSQYSSKVDVLPIAEALKQPDRYDREMRLLCLYGKSNGDLAWMRNRYYDGSGGWDECEPFCSEDAAVIRAKELLTDRLASPANAYSTAQVIESCQKIGVAIPPEFQAAHDGYVLGAAENAVATARKALESAEAKLAELTKEQP